MEENIRKYINRHRIEFLNSLPTEQFLEGFPGLHQYKRNQIKAILRNRGEFDANSDLLDAMLKIDDFPRKFIAFCVKHDCCLDLAQGIKQELSRIDQDHRRIKSSQSTSQVSNLPNAEAGTSLENTVAGMSVQNVFVSNNENYEQSMSVTPCQSPESRNHQQKDEPLQKSSSFEDTNSQNNVSKIMNRIKESDSTSQNLYDNTAVGACQIVDRNHDENTEGLNTSSPYSSSFMLSDSDLQNCNMSSCHEITNLKLNIQEKEEKESGTYVQPRQHIPSNLSQVSIENNEEVTPVFEVNRLGPVVGQNIPTSPPADLSVKKKLTLENVDNQAVSVTPPPADNVSAAQYSSMDKSSVMVAVSSDDWNYVSINCHSLGEPNIPETEEDIQHFDILRTCYERIHNFKGVQCQEDLQNHKLLPITVNSNAACTETNDVSLEKSEESSNTEVKGFGFTPENNFTYMEPPDKQKNNSEVKNNIVNETPDTENFNARSRDSFQDSSDESFVQGLTELKADDGDLQVKEGHADTDLQLKEGHADTDLQLKEGHADTDLQLKEGHADTDLQLKEGHADTDLQLKEGHDDTEIQLKEGHADTDLQLKEGNADTDHQLKEGNADTDLQLKEGNADTDLQLKEGNADTDLQLKEGHAETDLQLKEGNAETDLQLKEGNPDAYLKLKEGD
ncbi:unnamed protein product, partial [Lymnaea stagnalis]